MDIVSAGFYILSLMIVVYLGIMFILMYRQNPKPQAVTLPLLTSTVTHTSIGSRGDMGNQIFQIAATIAAAKRSGADAVFPSHLDSLPITQLFDLSGLALRDVVPAAIFYEYENYEHIVIPPDGRNYDIRGYRQAYNYFEDYADDIRRLFKPKGHILNAVRSVVPERYIAVHIRKGDYVKAMHAIPLLREFKKCSLEYYKAGIRKLRERYPRDAIMVCTDSPRWVATILHELDSNIMLAPTVENISPKYTDFCVLYEAEAVVMSNSTYSWWACYLRPYRNIICPTPWWDPVGFVGTALGLHGPYLHHPDWYLADAESGNIVRYPHQDIHNVQETDGDTLNLYKLVRGIVL